MFKFSGKSLSPFAGLDLLPIPTPSPCAEQDVRTVLGKFTLTDLGRLDRAFDQGNVIRRSFSNGGGQGCLLYHLDNSIVSFTRQLRFFAGDTAAYEASQKLIAAWDSEKLTEVEMRRILKAEIEARTAAMEPTPRSWTSRLVDRLTEQVRTAPNAVETGKKARKASAPSHEPAAV